MSATGFVLRKKKAEALKKASVAENVTEAKTVDTVEEKTETVSAENAEAITPAVKRGRTKKEN